MNAKQIVCFWQGSLLLLLFCLYAVKLNPTDTNNLDWQPSLSSLYTNHDTVPTPSVQPYAYIFLPGQDKQTPISVQLFSTDLCLSSMLRLNISRMTYVLPRCSYKTLSYHPRSRLWPVPSLFNLRNRPMLA